MKFSEYQERSHITTMYPNAGNDFVYPALGLVSEAGEVADKLKKLIRDEGVRTPADLTGSQRQELAKELGDVLWYTTQLARECGLTLEEVAASNIEKLHSRKDRGKLSGSGDNR